MASSQTTVSEVYEEVIKDVIRNIRQLFVLEGLEETILQDLQQSWKSKLFKSGTLLNDSVVSEATQESVLPAQIPVTSKPLEQVFIIQLPPFSVNENVVKEMLNEANLNLANQGCQNQMPNTVSTLSDNSSKQVTVSQSGTTTKSSKYKKVMQADGSQDSTSEDDSFSEDKESDETKSDKSELNNETPLNSDDDITDDDIPNTENIIVCQYEKVTRRTNKWKFYLKSGIMNISGKDFIFKWLNGEAEW